MENLRNLIVIGASAGGIPAISKVIAGLPDTLDAAVLAVIHVSRKSNSSIIAHIFQKNTSLRCVVATDGMMLQRGHLYIAPADHQMMVKDGTVRVNQGPHENKYRPSIDVLFRSAAVSYGHRVIGVVLTGLLEDGTSGMYAIKRSGGICIVQDPSEAQFPDMPRSVLNKIAPDYIAPLDGLPDIIAELVKKPLPPAIPIPVELQIEADITEKMMTDIDQLKLIADHSDFTCPDCGGGLWAVKDDPTHRYRCHTGHVYNEKILNDLQDDNIEETIMVCIRMLEEKENLLRLMTRHEREEGDTAVADAHLRRVNNVTVHINRLRSFLMALNEDRYNLEPPEAV